jgi:catechol 2,3-dioxygenase-like lactoylglutathione lyase family enzyme
MRFLVAIIVSSTLVVAAHAQGQRAGGGPPPDAAPVKGATTGFMHAIHATDNVDTTLAFYRDVFGLGLTTNPSPFRNPNVPLLTDSPGVNLRVAMLAIPGPGRGMNFELTEFTNTPRKPAQPKITDPGAPFMKFIVKDIAAVVAAAKQRGATFITTSAAPVDGGVFMRDPDGYIVAALQQPATAETTGNLLGSEMGLVIGDMDATMKFWRDMMGWEFTSPSPWSGSPQLNDLFGVPRGTNMRSVRAIIPGSTARIEMIQFQNVKGTPFDLRVPDPGASGMAIRVAAIQELLPKLKAAGVRVISKDQALVEWDAKTRNVFIKDPNGLLIEIVGTVAPPPQ